ncbi:hypothetical protein NP493_320g02062 [Ridgeia piscesae]|uniref:Uncharacterized protein n=1 Tax=Ridgeia piscesae TaxID=27915 RepID=A0AAD9L4I3_RIDPI|nr:hypothetical protein NP493_320g02062 [Ridgeia piscesae]
MAFLLLPVLALAGLLGAIDASFDTCDFNCELPRCYCNNYKIPGGLSAPETPQMVLFTFSDRVSGNLRKTLIDIFPDSLRNPQNDCPVSLTIFVLGSGSDYCAVHKLYVRGHEIATYGINRTGNTEEWTEFDWEKQFIDHAEEMVEKAFLPDDHVRGARTPLQKPGGDNQYNTLYGKGFMYDSTLLGGAKSLEEEQLPPWPVTLDIPWGNRFQCLTPRCPTKSYDGFWELPILRLINPENGRMCAFLDDCVVSLRTPNDVYRLLYLNFRHHYDTNRAPMMINLATKTLKNKVAVAGLKMFLQTIVSDGHDDTFLVTFQDVIAWMESPQPISKVGDLWICPPRKFHRCDTEDDIAARTRGVKPVSPFRSILFVDQLWIFQMVFLMVSYFIVRRYDRLKYKKT